MYAIRSYYVSYLVVDKLNIDILPKTEASIVYIDYTYDESDNEQSYEFAKDRITSYNVCYTKLLRLLLMGSAYALWTDSVTVNVTAQSATMDVLINYRAVSVAPTGTLPVVTDIGTPVPAVIDAANTTDIVEETITNFRNNFV